MRALRNPRKRLVFLLAMLVATAGYATTATAMEQPPEGYCSNNVIDCRGDIFCYNGCGGINWGQTWTRWFG